MIETQGSARVASFDQQLDECIDANANRVKRNRFMSDELKIDLDFRPNHFGLSSLEQNPGVSLTGGDDLPDFLDGVFNDNYGFRSASIMMAG